MHTITDAAHLTHPKAASACAHASSGCSGATATKAAISAVTAQPAAVTYVSMSMPLCTATTWVPSVICVCVCNYIDCEWMMVIMSITHALSTHTTASIQTD